MKVALYYESLKEKKVHCHLCPHNCVVQVNKTGICRQRKNIDGVLYSMNYGQVTSVSLDPMEKKPLYHFFPGTQILSVGTNGCNLSCQFCQNWSISQQDSVTEKITPEQAVKMAKYHKTGFIAYTYNEPLIWYEFVLDTARLAKEQGIMNVLVTNGYINPEPLAELLPYISAMNIDIKSISNDFYTKLCKAKLEPVLETARLSREKAYIEITCLLIPGENDTPEQIEGIAKWVAENLGKDTPIHFSAYYPSYKFDAPSTPPETLFKAYEIARKHLYFVYLGNIMGNKEGKDTFCFKCGNKLIERMGYHTRIIALTSEDLCNKCGSDNNIYSNRSMM